MANNDKLRILSICWYVVAGLVYVCGSVPLIHVALGGALATGALSGGPNPPPAWIGFLFMAIGIIAITITYSLATAMVFAGRFLQARKNWTFILVVSAISCLQMPFGTIMGVLTIITLMDESVKVEFGRAGPGTQLS